MRNLTFILLSFLCTISYAEDSIFNHANELYSQKKYTEAIQQYDSILSNGLESSELYYNIGNAHYKNKDWASAIWSYEKSLKLNHSEEAQKNLDLTNTKIIDHIEELPKLFYTKWWESFISILNTKQWQILLLIITWTILIFLILSYFSTFKQRKTLRLLYVFMALVAIVTYSSYQSNHMKKEAIIFESAIVVKSAPSSNSTELFTLHSGTKIEIKDEIGEWIQVKIVNGNTGWILSNSVKEL